MSWYTGCDTLHLINQYWLLWGSEQQISLCMYIWTFENRFPSFVPKLTDRQSALKRNGESPQGQRSVQFSGCVLVLLDSVHSVAKCFHCHLNLYLCDGLVKVRMWCWTATRGQALVPCGTCCVVSDELVTCSQRLSVLLLQVSSRELLTREIYTPGF